MVWFVYAEPPPGNRADLMEAALDWCKANEIDFVILHASAEGRALYESLGFRPGNEMRMKM